MFSNEYDQMEAHVNEGLTVENHLATYHPNNPCLFIAVSLSLFFHPHVRPFQPSAQMLVTYCHLYVKKR